MQAGEIHRGKLEPTGQTGFLLCFLQPPALKSKLSRRRDAGTLQHGDVYVLDSRLRETEEGAASGEVVGPGVAPGKKRGQQISPKLPGIPPDTLHLPSE